DFALQGSLQFVVHSLSLSLQHGDQHQLLLNTYLAQRSSKRCPLAEHGSTLQQQ
ncbi:unnamed protein product, partial [Allacma fusca]